MLARLDEIEAAAGELRRAVLTHRPTTPACARLTQLTGQLARQLDNHAPSAENAATSLRPAVVGPAPATFTEPATKAGAGPVTQPVTESVTETGAATEGGVARRRATPADSRPGARRPSVFSGRRVGRPEPLDLDTVRLERIVTEAGETAGWRVLAGDTDTPTQVGTVKHGRRGRWEALNASLVEVPGGPWRTRQDAVVHLLDQHQRHASARRSP